MKFVYADEHGSVNIVIAAERNVLERDLGVKLTEEEYRDFVLQKSIPGGAQYVQIMPDEWRAPYDRKFRNAWRLKGDVIDVDMPAAREIQRNRIRSERSAKLEALDVEMMRALEQDDKAAQRDIASAKQKLRDAPAHPALEAAATPEQLAALTLDDLV